MFGHSLFLLRGGYIRSQRKLVISLDGDERSALTMLAERERRDPRAQAALLIRNELIERGLLAADANPNAEHDGVRVVNESEVQHERITA